jgi:hypothetical protein
VGTPAVGPPAPGGPGKPQDHPAAASPNHHQLGVDRSPPENGRARLCREFSSEREMTKICECAQVGDSFFRTPSRKAAVDRWVGVDFPNSICLDSFGRRATLVSGRIWLSEVNLDSLFGWTSNSKARSRHQLSEACSTRAESIETLCSCAKGVTALGFLRVIGWKPSYLRRYPNIQKHWPRRHLVTNRSRGRTF